MRNPLKNGHPWPFFKSGVVASREPSRLYPFPNFLGRLNLTNAELLSTLGRESEQQLFQLGLTWAAI